MQKTIKEAACGDCKHYLCHYVRSPKNGRFINIHYGHCIFPRVKPRDDDTPACKNFTPKPSKEKYFR